MIGDNNGNEYLFITEVGSRMWGMEEFASDYDLFNVYQQPSTEFLRTSSFKGTMAAKSYVDIEGREIDAQFMEIGHLINLLKKGNVNAIWGACSPVIHKGCPDMHRLRDIVRENLSTQSYASINGMAHSQMNDAVKRVAVKSPEKSRATAARTLLFGINLLDQGKTLFTPVTNTTPAEIGELFRRLEDARENSDLPEIVDPVPFEDFLYDLRIKEIQRSKGI